MVRDLRAVRGIKAARAALLKAITPPQDLPVAPSPQVPAGTSPMLTSCLHVPLALRSALMFTLRRITLPRRPSRVCMPCRLPQL
eukprot:4704301-Pyramimonas_sp.AAC.1